MTENNPSSVSSAFEMLLRNVEVDLADGLNGV